MIHRFATPPENQDKTLHIRARPRNPGRSTGNLISGAKHWEQLPFSRLLRTHRAIFCATHRREPMATTPEPLPDTGPQPVHPEIPVPNPDDHPAQDQPIEPTADLPPEADNASQDDEEAQSQTFADASSSRSVDDFGLDDSDKVSSGNPDDDVQDLVDHMRDMVQSGRIDMDAYRGERNDDDEEGALGPDGELD